MDNGMKRKDPPPAPPYQVGEYWSAWEPPQLASKVRMLKELEKGRGLIRNSKWQIAIQNRN